MTMIFWEYSFGNAFSAKMDEWRFDFSYVADIEENMFYKALLYENFKMLVEYWRCLYIRVRFL